jgi:MoaA/NifB/PqqE/SkfB family radical SAM enzyme
LGPNGEVKNCSINKNVLGNIQNNDIENILLSNNNVKIKEELLNNVKSWACSSCWETESLQNNTLLGTSNRSYFKRSMGKVIPLTLFDSSNNFKLKQVDLRWRNTCNLACVYCFSDLSSTWAKELNEELIVDEKAIERTKKYVFDNINELEHVYLCGGEPLLMKENLEFIKLIQEKKPNIHVRVNTNLTNINSPIYQSLLDCKNVHWIVSVDSIEENFEYIRYGANWVSWLDNLKQLQEDSMNRNHQITFNMVWCALNAIAIFDAIDLFIDMGFSTNSFIIQVIQIPDELLLKYVNFKTKKLIKSILETRIPITEPGWLKTGYGLMQTEINKEYVGDNKPLLEFIRTLDTRRNINGESLFANLL